MRAKSLIRIVTHKDFQQRQPLTFCYLCGSRLNGGEINVDHPVPQALFPRATNDSSWRPTLRVHEHCHRDKSKLDDKAALWERMNTCEESEWPDVGRIVGLGLTPQLIHDKASGEYLPGFAGVNPLVSGAMRWLQGCFALTYGTFLPFPSKKVGAIILPPMPAIGPKRSLQDDLAMRAMMHRIISHAQRSDKWDGIEAWDGQMQFGCVWVPRTHKRQSYRFAAWLKLPRSAEYQRPEFMSVPSPWMFLGRVVYPPSQRQLLEFPVN